MNETKQRGVLHHDALVKATLAPVEHARGFFASVLPQELLQQLDLRTLTLVPTNYVGRMLGQLYTDLFYSVELVGGGNRTLHLAFEHESTVKKLIPVRFERARTYFIEQWLKDHEDASSVPGVFPVLLHHGRWRWTAPLEYRQVLDPSPEPEDPAAPYLGHFQVLLVDLSRYFTDWQLWESAFGHAASASCQLTLMMLQHAPDNPDFIDFLRRRTVELMRDVLEAEDGLDALAQLFRYIEAVNDYLDADELRVFVVDVVGPGAEELVMGKTIGELKREWLQEGRAEGRAEGRTEGRAETLLKLIQLRHGPPDAATVERVRGASEDALDRWTERILGAPTLEALFEDEAGS